jgi:hypothetical protein
VGHPVPGADGDRLARLLSEERRLAARIGGLAPAARAALAAAVAGRLLPHYLRFHEQTGQGEPAVLETALDGVWNLLRHGTPFDVVTVGVACLDQAQVAVDHGRALAGTVAFDAWKVVNGAATPRTENAVYAASAVARACHVAVHGQVREALHSLRDGRGSALALALSRQGGVTGAQSVRVAERDPLVRREVDRQLLDLGILEASGPTAAVLTKLRARG